MKHLPFDARQRQNRNIDRRDDDHAEEHGRADLLARCEHDVGAFFNGERAAKLMLLLAELANDVFHNDDCAINDEAEINRAQAHQVAGDAQALHAREGEQKRQGNR